MEIQNHGNNLKIHHSPQGPNRSATTGSRGAGASAPAERVSEQQILERLESDNRLRKQLLVEVKAKVLAGEYATRAAAEEAARNIVGE